MQTTHIKVQNWRDKSSFPQSKNLQTDFFSDIVYLCIPSSPSQFFVSGDREKKIRVGRQVGFFFFQFSLCHLFKCGFFPFACVYVCVCVCQGGKVQDQVKKKKKKRKERVRWMSGNKDPPQKTKNKQKHTHTHTKKNLTVSNCVRRVLNLQSHNMHSLL